MFGYQNKKYANIQPFLNGLKYNANSDISVDVDEQKTKLKKIIENFDGSLLSCCECSREQYLRTQVYNVINYNRMISDLAHLAIKLGSATSVEGDYLLKCFECLKCFEDISMAASLFIETKPSDWLHNFIVENLIEKYCLVYLDKFPIHCLHDNAVIQIRKKMNNINDRILFVFNNLFTDEYIAMRYHNAAALAVDATPKYEASNQLTSSKFNVLINLMQNIVYSNEILDQLSDAALTVWETLINEILFNQYFNEKMQELHIDTNDQSAEKLLLYLNRLRLQHGNESKEMFMNFFNNICRKLQQENIKVAVELIENVHYQFITFEQAYELISTNEINEWERKLVRLKESIKESSQSQTDRTARDIVDLMLMSEQGLNSSLSKNILETIAEKAKLFKYDAQNMKSDQGDEYCKVNSAIQTILNNKDYQNDPAKYVYMNLQKVVPLLLHAWYVANKPQLPRDNQIVALLIFIYSEDSGMLQQIKTGEGKTLIVALVAAFMALCGKAVDIVSSNRDLAIEGEMKCRSFYKLLKIDSGHNLSEDEEVRKQAYKPNLSTGNVVYGDVGSFQRDILEDEFNNKDIFGKCLNCLLIEELNGELFVKSRAFKICNTHFESNCFILILRRKI